MNLILKSELEWQTSLIPYLQKMLRKNEICYTFLHTTVCTAKVYAICIPHYILMAQFPDYFKILLALSIFANSNGHLEELENVYIHYCNII